MVTSGFVTKEFVVLILAATTISGPLLDKIQLGAQAAEFQLASSGGGALSLGAARNHQHQQAQPSTSIKTPSQLIDCERVITSDGRTEETEYCFAIIEAALRSSYGIDMVRSMMDNVAAAAAASGQQQQQRNGHTMANGQQQQQHKARRDLRSPAISHRVPGFVQEATALGGDMLKGQSGEALSKLIMNGLNEASSSYSDEYSTADGNDKPLWSGSMSDELQSRWQPMRGKRD